MPLHSLNLLLEYNQERLEEECACDDDSELPTREAAFIDLAETLAVHPQITSHLLPMLANPELNTAQKQMIFYLLWLGDDETLAAQALEIHFQTDQAPFDLQPALALLDTKKQPQAITQLAAQNSKATCQMLAGHFLANASETTDKTHLPLFLGEAGQTRFEGGVFDQWAAQSQSLPLQQSLINRFESATGTEKTALAKTLLLAQNNPAAQHKALDWLSQEEGMAHDHCLSFALLSSPDAVTQLNALKNIPLPEALLLDIAAALKWYGNPRNLPFLRWGMQHGSVKVKQAFHGVLIDFFDQDNPVMFEGFLLKEEEAAAQSNYTERLEQFWTTHEKTLKQRLKKQRYVQSTPFNLNHLLNEYTGKYSQYDMAKHTSFSQFVTHLSLWTGEPFYFDENALYSKQCAQIRAIKEWLAQHHERFPEGKWYQFGKDVSDF